MNVECITQNALSLDMAVAQYTAENYPVAFDAFQKLAEQGCGFR